jgi:predicted nuclease of predicted toxin-antitoxin system
VKLLFDENLPPRLVDLLADLYPGSLHVHQCGLSASDDSAVWEYARKNGLTIVSKDSDFQERSILLGAPPKVIWLRTSNCASAQIEFLLRTASTVVSRFIEQDRETCLILGQRPMKKKP